MDEFRNRLSLWLRDSEITEVSVDELVAKSAESKDDDGKWRGSGPSRFRIVEIDRLVTPIGPPIRTI